VINEDSVAAGTIALKRPKPNDIRVLIDFKPPNPGKSRLRASRWTFTTLESIPYRNITWARAVPGGTIHAARIRQ